MASLPLSESASPSPLPSVEAERGRRLESWGIALAFAMLLAALYVGEIAWKYFVRETFVAASRDVAWMAPLSAATYLSIFCAPFILAAPFLHRLRARQVVLFVAAFVTVFAFLLPWTQVHRIAAVFLALGAGSAAARALSGDGAIALVRRTGATVAAALGLIAVIILAGDGLKGRRAWAALPAADPGAPNVLFIILDTVRASAMSLYGYERETTPAIDAFSREGVVFDHAIATSPWTLPSHATLFTGEYPGPLSTSFRTALDSRNPTLAETFRDAGYETLGITANLHYTGWDSGLDRGFLRYIDFPRRAGQVLRSGWIGQSSFMLRLQAIRQRWQVRALLEDPRLLVVPKPGGDELNAEDLTETFLAWHSSKSDRPYFAFLNYFDAHADYRPPPEFRTHFTEKPTPRDLYDGEILYTDRHVGRLLDELQRRGALENTLVVITSDHGEQFGEHNRNGHGNTLYYQLLHVPLVMRFDKELPAGVRIDEPVSLRDLPATILAIARPAAEPALPGQSLAALWKGDSAAMPTVSAVISELTMDSIPRTSDPLTRSELVSLVAQGHHWILKHSGGGKEELYAVPADMEEERDLAPSEAGKRIAAELREQLRALFRTDAPSVSR